MLKKSPCLFLNRRLTFASSSLPLSLALALFAHVCRSWLCHAPLSSALVMTPLHGHTVHQVRTCLLCFVFQRLGVDVQLLASVPSLFLRRFFSCLPCGGHGCFGVVKADWKMSLISAQEVSFCAFRLNLHSSDQQAVSRLGLIESLVLAHES